MPMDGTPIIIKKKKVHAHEHHGGSWKVAYADFVTAMMAFFLTLWIMGLSDSTRTQVAGYFSDPLGFAQTPPFSKSLFHLKSLDSPKPGQAKEDGMHQEVGGSVVQKTIGKIAGNGQFKKLGKLTTVTWGDDGVRIEFAENSTTQFFEIGSSHLTPEAAAYVRALGTKLGPTVAHLKRRVTVEGYTDARQYAGAFDNFDLSENRALALKHALQSGGMTSGLFAGAVGYGDKHLKEPQDPYAADNRRVTIWIHPAESSLEAEPKKLSILDDGESLK